MAFSIGSRYLVVRCRSNLKTFCQALVPIPLIPNPNPVQPSSNPNKPKRGLGLTLKSCRPPTTHPPQLLSMKEGSHKKVQKIRMVQNGPPYLSVKKKFRWTARGRTWSSPPSSARTSSILFDTPLSKCQGLTQKPSPWGPTTPLTSPTHQNPPIHPTDNF